MKIVRFTLSLVLSGSLVACAQINPIPREQLVANMDTVLEIEQRADQIRFYTQMLASRGGISEGKSKELKKRFDIFYFYYLASNVHLAKGDTKSSLAHVKLAERELDAIETIVKDGLAKTLELELTGEKDFAGANF